MTPATAHETEALLASILRGDVVSRAAISQWDPQSLYGAACEHDVLPLVADRLGRLQAATTPPWRVFHEDASRAVVMDMARELELQRLLKGLEAGGVETVLMKGSHLAYSHYLRPDLRSRIDTDLLVPPAARQVVDDLLTRRLGYVASVNVSGDLTATQKLYATYTHGVPIHVLDVHWRLSSPQVFAHVLSFDELAASAVPLPRLGPTARGPSDVHALLIACVHRVAHHLDVVRFKWLFDIHLIASRFTDAQWDAFVSLAVERKVAMVCRRSLERTVAWFHTPVPSFLWSDARFSVGDEREVSAGYLEPRPQIRLVLDDLRALRTWRDRTRLAREHILPSAEYMRTTYAPRSPAPLVVLYAIRLFRGAIKWFRPS